MLTSRATIYGWQVAQRDTSTTLLVPVQGVSGLGEVLTLARHIVNRSPFQIEVQAHAVRLLARLRLHIEVQVAILVVAQVADTASFPDGDAAPEPGFVCSVHHFLFLLV